MHFRTLRHKPLASGFDTAFQEHVQEWVTLFAKTAVSSFIDLATNMLPRETDSTAVGGAVLLMGTVSENAITNVNNAPINNYGLDVCGHLSDCYGGQRYWDQDIWMGP